MGTTEVAGPPRPRRPYDNLRRRQQAAGTRRRIVAAGSELLHESDVRDWGALTVRAVAERAGVSERTVYRHFENERGLRDAVMHRLEEEAGVELEGMAVGDVAALAARVFRHVASFRPGPGPTLDPTLTATRRRLHAALLEAVATAVPHWSAADRAMAAAVLDLLSSVDAYERLARDWDLDAAGAAAAVGWAIAAVGAALADHPPSGP